MKRFYMTEATLARLKELMAEHDRLCGNLVGSRDKALFDDIDLCRAKIVGIVGGVLSDNKGMRHAG